MKIQEFPMKILGSDENLRVSDENLGVSDETVMKGGSLIVLQ